MPLVFLPCSGDHEQSENVAEILFHVFFTTLPLLSSARYFEADGLSACLLYAGGLSACV